MSLSVTKPTIGQPVSTEDPKIVTGLTDIETWGNANDAKIANIVGAWKPLFSVTGVVGSAFPANTSWISAANGGPIITAVDSGNAPSILLYIDPADYAITGFTTQLRLQAVVTTNATAPAVNFTLGLYPVSAVAGAAGVHSITLGTVHTSIAINTPALSSTNHAASAPITMPAANYMIPGIVNSGTTASNSYTTVSWLAQYRYI